MSMFVRYFITVNSCYNELMYGLAFIHIHLIQSLMKPDSVSHLRLMTGVQIMQAVQFIQGSNYILSAAQFWHSITPQRSTSTLDEIQWENMMKKVCYYTHSIESINLSLFPFSTSFFLGSKRILTSLFSSFRKLRVESRIIWPLSHFGKFIYMLFLCFDILSALYKIPSITLATVKIPPMIAHMFVK